MPTDLSEPVQGHAFARIIMPVSGMTLDHRYSPDDETCAIADVTLTAFDLPTGQLSRPIYVGWMPGMELRLISAVRAALASGTMLQLIDDIGSGSTGALPRVIESLARGSTLAASDLRAGLARSLHPGGSFDQGAGGLIEHLKRFKDITRNWPEFESEGFPQASIDRAIAFLREAWARAGRRGQAALVTGFCGPSEDGAVNCQWKRAERFLVLSVPAQGPCEAYFSDATTGEDFEGYADVEAFASWIERFCPHP